MRLMRDKMRGVPFRRLAGAGLRLLHPSLAMVIIGDRLGHRSRSRPSRRHLDAVMQWLCRAQDHGGGSGVSAGYSLASGWDPPYPETTGYLIPTFFEYARLTGREAFHARACRMADWEIEVQLASGAVQAGLY